MESIETFMELFKNSWSTNNIETLVRVFKDAPDFLQHIPKSDIERALETIFDEQKGLFKFVKTVLSMQKDEMINFKMPLKEAFNLIQHIMEIFHEKYESYVLHTWEIGFYCIKTLCWLYARKAASETLKKLIELFASNEQLILPLNEIIEHYNDNYLRLYSKKEGCVFYIVLGAIFRHCPKVQNAQKFADKLFLQLIKDLKNQIQHSDYRQPEEIKIYIDCYLDVLVNFIPFEDSGNQSSYFENLYSYLLILFQLNGSQKILRNKIVYFITTHGKHFSLFIFNDHEKWHKLLNNILDEAENTIAVQALKIFYQIIALHLVKGNHENIFLYFKNYFTLKLVSSDVTSYKSRLIIYGLGEFSNAYAKYLVTEIHEIFQMISVRTLLFYTKENEIQKDFDAIVDYLQALSRILCQMPSVSLHHINIIMELSTLFAKRFPELNDVKKKDATDILISTFVNIFRLEKNHQNEYFNSFVQEGILWSCSHALYIDVELQKNTVGIIPEKVFTYKDYLPLWQSIFTTNHQKAYSNTLVLQIFEVFVSVLMSSIEKLNLNVKAQENNVFSDMSFSFKAENETDFRFFINLVDLCVEIFEEVDVLLLQNWMENLFMYLIKISYKNSWISGFYKLFEVILKKLDFLSVDEKVPLNESTVDLIFQYLLDIIQLVYKFTGELQLSCIYLILNAPVLFVKKLVDQTIPIFKIAFNIGLTDLTVASSALDTLEKWIGNSDIKCSKDFLKAIVSYIEPYLSTEENKIDQIQLGIRRKKRTEKSININESEESLEALQKRILLFYGSLDLSALFEFVHEKSIATDATWNKKDLVQCELLFPGTRLEIHLDKFIPRITELTSSGDRKLKLSACELLHTVVTMMLGKKLMDQCFNKSLYRSLLWLSCDSDDTVRNLYHPFLIQLTHYLSTNTTRTPQDFVDSLFDGLSEKLNTILRDHCALYLKEFITWSSQHGEDENDPMTVLDVNIKGVIRRIINFALYPSNEKRLAAAIAFDHLHPIFRSSVSILNTYWLEFFYAFVKSLEECDDSKIVSALDHIESAIEAKSELFNASSRDRRVPTAFNDGTLNGLLTWLFSQCTSRNLNCRRKSMELFEKLLPYSSFAEIIKASLGNKIGAILLRSFRNERFSLTVENVKTFLTILDVYIWILKKKFLPFENCFSETEDKNIFIKCFSDFVSSIITKHEEICAAYDNVVDSKLEELENLSSQGILKVFEFVTTLLKENRDSMEEFHWDDSLYLLIARCTLFPHKVGITPDKLQVNEKLPCQLHDLLLTMKNRKAEIDTIKFREKIVTEANSIVAQFTDIQSIVHDKSNIQEFKQLLKGLHILKKSNFLDFEKEFNFTQIYLEDVINRIFTALKIEVMNYDSCKKINDDVKDYLIEMLKFFLEKYQSNIVELLVKLINTDTQLNSLSGSTITHGEYFLELFRESIFLYMLNGPVETMKIFDNFLDKSPDKMFQLLEDLLIFARHQKESLEKKEILADAVIERFSVLHRLINDIEYRRKHFLNIYRLVVSLKAKPTEAMVTNGLPNELYTWTLGELLKSKSLEYKTLLLRYFLVALTDENSNELNPELSIVFQGLRDYDNNSTWLETIKTDETLRFQAASCFQVLLKMLVMTKSLVVFQAVIQFSAGVYIYIHHKSVNEYLTSYFSSISDSNAQKSLQLAYKIFWDVNSFRQRLDILKRFLIPSIEASKADAVGSFYDDHFHEMALCIRKEIDCSSTTRMSDKIKLIVSKIGCYSLFELVYVKFPSRNYTFEDPLSKTQKPLNQFLVQQAMHVRSYSAGSQDEKEPARLLHCAALNCCIALISLKSQENFYKFIFFEDRKKDQLIWERIIDCEREYRLEQEPNTLRKERKKLINIRSSGIPAGNPSATYFRRYDLTSLSLFEDVHFHDLNNIRILSQTIPVAETEPRLKLRFEDDQLNEHECMPMLSGVLIHMFNSGISQLPTDGRQYTADDLPLFLRLLRNAFAIQQSNVQLFLYKLLINTSKAFMPYMAAFFAAIAGSLCFYLSTRNLNCVIRETLILLIESNYVPQDEQDRRVAQRLLQRLVERAPPSNPNERKYNFELLETVWSRWSGVLEWPTIPEDDILDPEVVMHIVLTGLRTGGRRTADLDARLLSFVRNRLENWRDAELSVLTSFEAMGWLLRDAGEERCQEESDLLVKLLGDMARRSPQRCIQCVCVLYKASGSEVLLKPLLGFLDARKLTDNQRISCLKLLADRLASPSGCEEAAIPAELLRVGLESALAERWPGSEAPALQLLQRLVPLLSEPVLRPLLKLAAGLAAPRRLCLLNNRLLALELLSEAWRILPTDSPSSGICANTLLSVLQPGEPVEVQDVALKAWRERLPQSRSANARLLALLTTLRGYELADRGSAAARLLCLLLLELAAESPRADSPMFRPLMEGLNFREYQPLATYRAPSLGSMAPLFAPSLAASWNEASRMGSLELTSLEQSVQPTQSGFLIPEPSQNRFSLRSMSTPHVTRRRQDYHEQLRKELELARRDVRLHRKYRLGDLPDVEITYSSFVESLRQFILRDWLTCRELAVELIYQLIENSCGGDDHEMILTVISTAIENLLEDPDAQDEFGLILLEVALRSKTIRLDAVAAARLCRASGFNSLGILLLEEKLLSAEEKINIDESSQLMKRLRSGESSDHLVWMQLVELQKELGETDTVTGILCREGLFSLTLKQAAKAQATSKWLEATSVYEQGYEIGMGSEKDYCLEGMFECMSELSSWDLINRKIDNILCDKYDRVWEEKDKQRQLLPWLFEAQLQQTLDGYTACKDQTNNEFINQFDSWIEKGYSIVKRPYGEHLSVFSLLSRNNQLAGQSLKNSIDHWKEQWIRLSPLSEKLKMQILTRLRGIHNINAYLQAVKSADIQTATAKLIQYWDQHLPNEKQDLLSWNKHVFYRLAFAQLLQEQLTNVSDDDPLLNELSASCVRQRMKMSELAMLHHNKNVLKKHTQMTDRILHVLEGDYADLTNDFHLIASKYKLMNSETESNNKKKCKYFLASWEITEKLINDENVENSLKMKAHHHLFDVIESIQTAVEENEDFRSFVENDPNILDKLQVEKEQNLINALRNYGFISLKSACELESDGNDKQLAESYTKFGKYCYSLLRHFRADNTVCLSFISAILSGMNFGSLEATQYFSSLLKYEYYRENEEARQIFLSKSDQVPSWLFITWQAQILSNLNKPIGELLIPIVKRLICDYPNAIIYSFHQTYEASPNLKDMPEICSMYEMLFHDTKIKTFFEAMHCVCQPEHYLRHQLVELVDSKNVSPELIENILKKTFRLEAGKNTLQGPLFKELEKYHADLIRIKQLDFEIAKVHLQQMATKLLEGMKIRLKNFKKRGLQLKDYSPYLNDFTGEDIDIEIPGQYNGMRKPIPRYHAKISKFDRFVRVMESKCNPVKISLIGNDAKVYGFLVKFGEDLRQDQRLQQTFNLMNTILEQDKNCNERYLSINTYHVVPLSTSLGLIQWIDETKTLKEFIEFSMKDKTLIDTVSLKYNNWILAAGKSDFKTNSYKKAVIKYTPKDVICKMREFIKSFNWDSLRKTFLMLSTSLDCFVSLRKNFTKSYATMCIIHWITGIGDRHLENMLIEVKTANCYGIDFGSAFGIGIDQSVPELVPFRLTPQILGLLQPYSEQGLFAVTMTHVLTALQNKQSSILACLDIFVHEPLDWSKYARKQMDDAVGEKKDVIKWLPKRKITFVEKKLSGGKPSTIMLEELSSVHYDEDENDENSCFSKYKLIINGTDNHQISIRSKLNNELLTAEEQVQCLLEQAKDLNVLGRMFSGWCPFV